jgi:hypothetical protein
MSNHIIECGNAGVGFRNTGSKEQCLEGLVIRNALATVEQEFATSILAKTLASWKADRDLKKLFPLFEVEDLASANTEDTKKELRNRTITTALGKKIITYNAYISLCSHYALKSFHGKKMRYYGFSDKQEILAVTPDGTKVRGQLVTVEIGRRVDAVADNPPYTPVIITFADYNEYEDNAVVLKPDWSHIELDGIFDVNLKVISSTATEIKFQVLQGCGAGDEAVLSYESDDVVVKNSAGLTQTTTFTAPDADGIYTLTGTAFATGFVIAQNGIVAKAEGSYEAVKAVEITV